MALQTLDLERGGNPSNEVRKKLERRIERDAVRYGLKTNCCGPICSEVMGFAKKNRQAT